MRRMMVLLASACFVLACSQPKAEATDGAAAGASAETAEVAAAPAPAVTDAQRAAAYKALQLQTAGAGQVMNDCDEAITPQIIPADLGGAVGQTLVLVMGGGPNTLTCYGMTGMQVHVLKPKGDGYEPIFTDFGSLAIMDTTTNGVHDIAMGGPGFEFPVYAWNGKTFARSRTIKDTEFPQSLN